MTRILRIDEMLSRQAGAENAARLAKASLKKGDVGNAAKAWEEIYSMYEGDTSPEGFAELNKVMSLFTDDEVYTITDWLKSNSPMESVDFSKMLSGRVFESSSVGFAADSFVRVNDVGFNRKAYGKSVGSDVRDFLANTEQGFVMTFDDFAERVSRVTSGTGFSCRITGDAETKSYWCVFENLSVKKQGDAQFFGDGYVGHVNFSVVQYRDDIDIEDRILSGR